MATVSLKKWGNSIGIRIPAALLREAHLEPGETLEVTVNKDGAILLTPAKSRQESWLEQFNAIADASSRDEIQEFPNQFDQEDWTW